MSTVSLVTGGNRGIGREVCRQLAGHGHAVVLTARPPGRCGRRRGQRDLGATLPDSRPAGGFR